MWHPKDEAEATSELAALVEYLRATRLWPELDPTLLIQWAARDPAAFDAALAQFDGGDTKNAAQRSERRAAFFEAWKKISRECRVPDPR